MAPGAIATPPIRTPDRTSSLPSSSRIPTHNSGNSHKATHSREAPPISRKEAEFQVELKISKDEGLDWDSFPSDIQNYFLGKLGLGPLMQAKQLCKKIKARIEDDEFHRCRGQMHPREALLTALHFSVGKDGVWQWAGYDLVARKWMKLPSFRMLPSLDPSLFKDHSICGAGGLMCANVGTSVVVFNPLSGKFQKLPPLHHSRTPVLMQIIVDGVNSYIVIVAGSARAGHEHLSKVTEVFDSRTQEWTITEDVPGPVFALNEHQTGVFVNGILYCIAFLDGEDLGKGLIAYDVNGGKWLPHLTCSLPIAKNLSIVQLMECKGEVVLYSEIERNPYVGNVEHRIDMLESGGRWRNVVTETKAGNQAGLQTYPEYASVPFGEGKLCIFNTIVHTGVVYDVQSGERVGTLESPTWSRSSDEMGFYSMNPVTFSFEPSFHGNPEVPVLKVIPESGLKRPGLQVKSAIHVPNLQARKHPDIGPKLGVCSCASH